MEELNPHQRQAATATGPMVIIAGPGSGKTKTLTARIAHLIISGQARPAQILALTFTKKAAEQMRRRVAALLGAGRQLPTICTFHALCHDILGGEQAFVSEPQRLAIIKSLSRPAIFKGLTTRELGLMISRAKNGADNNAALARLVTAYNNTLRDKNLIDFDDLLLHTRDLLQRDNSLRQQLRQRYQFLLVDEFQDTNSLQYELLQLLQATQNVCVIGDPNQSIYSFRGASGGIFDQFKADFAHAQVVTLDTNYRSSPEVVRLSNAIFGAHPQRSARTQQGAVQAVRVLNEYAEARWVLYEIQQSIGGAHMQSSATDARRSLRDFAIIYRSRAVARDIQKCVADSGLPYQVVGDGSPYEQPSAQTLLQFLRCAGGAEPAAAGGFTAGQVQALTAKADVSLPPVQIAEQLAAAAGLEASADLQQVIGSLVRFATLAQALEYFDNLAQQSFYDPAAEAITLLTIHAAKGLEFSHVFLIGCQEGVLPHAKASASEEKRLFYVAVTRARDQLDVLHTAMRGGKPAKPSRFVTELSAQVLPRNIDPNLQADRRRAKKRQVKRAQTSLF